jgi:hypothetical protein
MTLPEVTTATTMTAHLAPGFCFEKHQNLRKEDLPNITIEIEGIKNTLNFVIVITLEHQ